MYFRSPQLQSTFGTSITATAQVTTSEHRGVYKATVHPHLHLRGVGRVGGKSIIDGIEHAQDEIDSINTNGRVRGVACVCSMRRAPLTGIIGGKRCLLSVCFRFFSTSESKKKSTCATMHE